MMAVIPPLYLIYRVYKLDSIEREPTDLIIKLLIFGVLSVIPTAIIEQLLDNFLVNGICAGLPQTQKLAVQFFIAVAWVEEGWKHFFLKRGSWNHPAFDFRFDAIVYSVVVSLGFAALENIMYVMQYGVQGALIRAVTAIPGHCIFGIFMGHYYGMAKMAQRRGQTGLEKRMQFMSLFIPIILHGFYDFAASMGNELWSIAFIAYIIILDIFAIRSIKRFASEDTPL